MPDTGKVGQAPVAAPITKTPVAAAPLNPTTGNPVTKTHRLPLARIQFPPAIIPRHPSRSVRRQSCFTRSRFTASRSFFILSTTNRPACPPLRSSSCAAAGTDGEVKFGCTLNIGEAAQTAASPMAVPLHRTDILTPHGFTRERLRHWRARAPTRRFKAGARRRPLHGGRKPARPSLRGDAALAACPRPHPRHQKGQGRADARRARRTDRRRFRRRRPQAYSAQSVVAASGGNPTEPAGNLHRAALSFADR